MNGETTGQGTEVPEQVKFKMNEIHPAYALSEVAGIVAADVPDEKKVALIRDYIDQWVERNANEPGKKTIFALGGAVAKAMTQKGHKSGKPILFVAE